MVPPEPELATAPVADTKPPSVPPPAPEEADLTWEDKEDKLDAENIQPDLPESSATDKKYKYKEGGSLILNPPQCLYAGKSIHQIDLCQDS